MGEYDAFVATKNLEDPKRPWIQIPESGSLAAGQALIAKGVGMELEQKLVSFKDPTMVRFVGNQPGDYSYTDLQACLNSLPTGAEDLSNPFNPYVIYIRTMILGMPAIPPGIELPDVFAITFFGLLDEGRPSVRTSIIFGGTSAPIGDNTFGMRLRTNRNTTTQISFINMDISANSVNNSSWTSNEFNVIKIERYTSSTYPVSISLYNSRLRSTVAHTSTPKTVRLLYIENLTGTTTRAILSLRLYDRSEMDNNLQSQYIDLKFLAHGENCSASFGASDNSIKRIVTRVSNLDDGIPRVLFDFLSSGTSTNEEIRIENVEFYILFQKTTTNFYSADILFFDIKRPPELFSGNNVFLYLVGCSLLLESIDTACRYNMDNIKLCRMVNSRNGQANFRNTYFRVGTLGVFGGFPVLIEAKDNEVILENNNLNGGRLLLSGRSPVQKFGSDFPGQLTSNNIQKTEKTISSIDRNLSGVARVIQSPINPPSPKEGDIWVKTNNFYD